MMQMRANFLAAGFGHRFVHHCRNVKHVLQAPGCHLVVMVSVAAG